MREEATALRPLDEIASRKMWTKALDRSGRFICERPERPRKYTVQIQTAWVSPTLWNQWI